MRQLLRYFFLICLFVPKLEAYHPYHHTPFLPPLMYSEAATPHDTLSGFKCTLHMGAFHTKGLFHTYSSGSYEGLLEREGVYNLRAIAQALESQAAFEKTSSPSLYSHEPGADAWKYHDTYFHSEGSLSGQAIVLESAYQWKNGIFIKANLPLWSLQARNYLMPNRLTFMNDNDLAQLERLQEQALSHLKITKGDWAEHAPGDLTLTIGRRYQTGRLGILRSFGCKTSMHITLPTGSTRDENHPAAVSNGYNGHTALSLEVQPEAEIKEGMFFSIPFIIIVQNARDTFQRVATQEEPSCFSPHFDHIKREPGISWSCHPHLMITHLFEKIHVSIGFLYGKSAPETLTLLTNDLRNPSYLREHYTSPTDYNHLTYLQEKKKAMSSFTRKTITLKAWYTLPLASSNLSFYVGYNHPWSGTQCARAFSGVAGIEWHY